ncbi:hypothetical protein L3Q67_35325 [Saccharothrix sp. AJ9571]|nr:hypothetical protein L3Q67_35325 [Saccharothrix sp. AJ9571]
MLVVLDNAVDAEQVRPLLPGAGKSAVLITSRHRLVSLDGVPPVSLEPLGDGDAAHLFGRAAGLTLAEEEALGQVLEQCGGLPLALRMAGARLRHRPGWTVAVLAERLRDNAGRFDSVFGMSLRQLDGTQRRVFRLLGVLPGEDFDAAVAGVLAGSRPAEVDAVLEELLDAHLVQELSPGRYRMHDLIRRYAADLAADEDGAQADVALRRVLNHYLAQAVAHDATLPSPHRPRPSPGDPARAMAWFDFEYTNLVAAFDAAVRLGVDEVVAELPRAMRVWFFRHRGSDDQARLLEAAAAAAGRLGRHQDRAALLSDLGFAHAAAGRLADALSAYDQAERAEPDEQLAAGLALRTGFARRDLGDLDAAQAQFRRARELFEKLGQRAGQAQALAFDGWVTLHLGRPGDAIDLARASVAMADGPARITGLVTLGVALAPDDPAESLRTLHDALHVAERHNLPHNQAWCHNYLGVALRVTGSAEQALEHHRRALELLEPLTEVQLEIDCLHTYAETCRVAGRHDEALALLDRTIALARKLDRPHDENLALSAREALTA